VCAQGALPLPFCPAQSDEEERALLMECGQRQGRWERHEADLEASVAASALSADQGLASRRQIFSAKEAFAMLSKELLNIIRQQVGHARPRGVRWQRCGVPETLRALDPVRVEDDATFTPRRLEHPGALSPE
jgi:hypothetical protein